MTERKYGADDAELARVIRQFATAYKAQNPDAIIISYLNRAADRLSTPPAGEVVLVPRIPSRAMWSGLARDIVMWMDCYETSGKTPANLFKHLEMIGTPIPQWLRDEPELQHLDHVPSKGTRAVIIYRAMIEDAPTTPAPASPAQAAAIISRHSRSGPGLTEAEKKQQAKRCGCAGADDWCPCQNTPDRQTVELRRLGQP